jgi:hypothetical protein
VRSGFENRQPTSVPTVDTDTRSNRSIPFSRPFGFALGVEPNYSEERIHT